MDLGLNTTQTGYAQTIIAEGHRLGMTHADIVTAIMVALDESGLEIYSNTKVPESQHIPHDNVGMDGYSVGIFQQQVGEWGTAAELMDPVTSADKFYAALAKVPGRAAMPLPMVAQTVQQSADPTGANYMLQQPRAMAIVAALDGNSSAAGTPSTTGGGTTWFSQKNGWQRIGLFAAGIAILWVAYIYLIADSGTGKAVIKDAVKAAVLV